MRPGELLFPLAQLAAVVFMALAVLPGDAHALKSIEIVPDQGRIEITTLGELYEGRGDTLHVETAAGADGIAGRMSVSATMSGTNPNWIVFALTNPTDRPVVRWLTADRYSLIGSGIVWPDLDARRIEAVTPSIGFVPERIESDRADIFRITLDPGQTITYVAEMSTDRFSRLYLWRPLNYETTASNRQLFNGVMLGLTGLMAIFLTAIFAANHKLIFPASALVAWCVLGYLCVHFGFFHKLFLLKPEGNAIYRAATEASLAASLVVFLHVFLRLALWHGLVRMLITVWLVAQFSLIAVAIIDPRLAATFARLSFAFIGAVGAGLTLFLALRGQDRALSLIPTWILFLVWIFGAAVALSGRLSGDMVGFGLVSGLVLILLLIGFTVTQYAFRSTEPTYGAAPSELQSRSIAVDASGASVWEWNARRDEVKVSPGVEALLGLSPGDLSSRTDDFARHVHPADRERFRLALFTVQERRDGKMSCDFRLRQADNNYRWFELEAAGVPGTDPRAFKCIGLLRDVTDSKRAHERLLHDAVHDSLTGLPNRELLLDRLEVAMRRAASEPQIRPTVLVIDIDKFTHVNSSLGLVLADSLLLTIARRLQRHIGANDTLGRVGGGRFSLLLLNDQPVAELAQYAERIRRSLRSPIKIAGQEVVLTGSIGIAVFDGQETNHHDLLKKAEIAMFRAKRAGADRIEVFTPEMQGEQDDRQSFEADLRRAMDKGQMRIAYLPIIYLSTEELAGFEAVVRWDHPELGTVDPVQFASTAEDTDIVAKLGAYMLHRAARDIVQWQKEFPRSDAPLFVSINVSCRHLFRQDVIQEIRHILGRTVVPKGSIRLEVTEQIALENPEQSTEVLEWLRGAGAEIVLDEFGTGYSSLPYLERLPFDTVKIDQALMEAGSVKGGNDSALVRSMVALAHELGKKVLAKGVENDTEVSFLRGVGAEYAQGAYCGDAIPESDVVRLLATVRVSENKSKPVGVFRPKSKKRRSAKRQGAPSERPEAARRPASPPMAAASTPPQGNGAAGSHLPSAAAAATNGAARPAKPAPAAAAASAGSNVPPPLAANGAANGKGAPPPAPPPQPVRLRDDGLTPTIPLSRRGRPAQDRAKPKPADGRPTASANAPKAAGAPPSQAVPPQGFAGSPPPMPGAATSQPARTRLVDVLPDVPPAAAQDGGSRPVPQPDAVARAPRNGNGADGSSPPRRPDVSQTRLLDPASVPLQKPILPGTASPPPVPFPNAASGASSPAAQHAAQAAGAKPGGAPPPVSPKGAPQPDVVATRPILVQPSAPPPLPSNGVGPGNYAQPSAPPAVPPSVAPPRPSLRQPPTKPAPAGPARPAAVKSTQAEPDFSNLPPAIAESLARLAGVSRK